MNFDFQFDIFDQNRIVLGVTYSKGLMTRVERDLETDEDISDPEIGLAHMFTIGLFFCAFSIITYSFE